MVTWDTLSNELKMCVLIYREQKAGRMVTAPRLVKLMDGMMTESETQRRAKSHVLIGLLTTEFTQVDEHRPMSYLIPLESMSFIKEIEDLLSKDEALQESKGGELIMPGEEKEAPKEEMPRSSLSTAIETLKRDHNWKYFVGMAVFIILQQLIKRL